MIFKQILVYCTCFYLLVGCSAVSKIDNNSSVPAFSTTQKNAFIPNKKVDKITLVLAFSGGGNRAAALSYGVMQALKNTYVHIDGIKERLLDEVDVISSVSGGSFTSAYYGLYGDKLFTNFASDFLYKDISGALLDKILSVDFVFSDKSRTQKVIEYYQKYLFHNKTFADIRDDAPLIVINATDLGAGIRFSFLQSYFDLICSNLATYPIASAVMASSAVPMIFNPVTLKNRATCRRSLVNFHKNSFGFLPSQHTIRGLVSYQDKKNRPYIHLVDGGITDNLGLLALTGFVNMSHETRSDIKKYTNLSYKNLVIISVDASAYPNYNMDKSSVEPSTQEIVSASSDISIHRYNDTTKSYINRIVNERNQRMQQLGSPYKAYFIDINLQSLTDAKKYHYFNNIPTDLTLDRQSVNSLIQEGNLQLKNNKAFINFLKNLVQENLQASSIE